MLKVVIKCTEMSGTGISGKQGDTVDVADNEWTQNLIKNGWLELVEEPKSKPEPKAKANSKK